MGVAELISLHVGAFALGWCCGWGWLAFRRVIESAT